MKLIHRILSHGLSLGLLLALALTFYYRQELFPRWFAEPDTRTAQAEQAASEPASESDSGLEHIAPVGSSQVQAQAQPFAADTAKTQAPPAQAPSYRPLSEAEQQEVAAAKPLSEDVSDATTPPAVQEPEIASAPLPQTALGESAPEPVAEQVLSAAQDLPPVSPAASTDVQAEPETETLAAGIGDSGWKSALPTQTGDAGEVSVAEAPAQTQDVAPQTPAEPADSRVAQAEQVSAPPEYNRYRPVDETEFAEGSTPAQEMPAVARYRPLEPAGSKQPPPDPTEESSLAAIESMPTAQAPLAAYGPVYGATPQPIAKPAQTAAASLDERHNEARKAYWARDYVRAQKLYSELTDAEGAGADLFGELGNIHFAQGHWAQAAAAYHEAAKRLIDAGTTAKAWHLLSVIRGLDVERAQELEQQLQTLPADRS